MSTTKVSFLMRRPRPHTNFSIELVFASVLEHLGDEFDARVYESTFLSNGALRRLYNIVEAALRQGDVNHVTGDVHFLVYLLRRDRTVLTIHDCGRIAGEMDWRKYLIRFLWFALPVRRCAAITVVSHAVKEDLLRHVRVAPDKVNVIPASVPSVYRRCAKPFNQERPRILQIGAKVNKNRARLFEALHGIPCTLDIVGQLSDDHKALLRRYALEYKNHVSVSNEEMLKLYSRCDIVAFPSTSEGFGMPIIEGNIVGRPVLTGNVTSMPEVAGDAACLVDPFDVNSIRAGFMRVIDDVEYREVLVRNGYENAQRFSAVAITRQYEELYKRVRATSVQSP